MRYVALASDYDGTLAQDGHVAESTILSLRRLRASGRRAILVTGRELSDLRRVFRELHLFDRIVAENGAHVFAPETGEEQLLGERPPEALIRELKARGVTPLSVGRVIVATWEPHRHTVLEIIRQLGLELQVIFNKGAVMVLPSGVNKARGLRAALADLGLSSHNVVGVGDAENDHALLSECELGVAVANALPMLKQHADLVTDAPRGAGVEELIRRLIDTDLIELEPALARRNLLLSADSGELASVRVHPYGKRVLVCGTSGSGKSTLVTAFLERLSDSRYQYCLIDPEGDFEGLAEAVVLGDEQTPPRNDEVFQFLEQTDRSCVALLLGLPLERRSAFFASFVMRYAEQYSQIGRPHWLVVDEAHHMLPHDDALLSDRLLNLPPSLVMVTVHPERLAETVLRQVDLVIVVGDAPRDTLHAFAERVCVPAPVVDAAPLPPDEALAWSPYDHAEPVRFCRAAPRIERRRHRRKYAAGELGPDKSFYFRGPSGDLHLRAQNLVLFLQLADGVDDETWRYHLRRGDYSHWVRDAIKNEQLAHTVARIEDEQRDAPADVSRARIRRAIQAMYTLPA